MRPLCVVSTVLTGCALAVSALTGCAPRAATVGTGWSAPLPPRLSPSLSVVRDAASLRQVGADRAVDFVRDQVVVLQAPTRHSRSHITVRRVDVRDGVVHIDACVRGSVVQTLSAPWVAVAVPADAREVTWACREEVHATATARSRR